MAQRGHSSDFCVNDPCVFYLISASSAVRCFANFAFRPIEWLKPIDRSKSKLDSEFHSAVSAVTMKDIKDNLSYWLALKASSFVYNDEADRTAALGADKTCIWRLDCGNLCEHAATAKLRKETKQFMTFDVQIAGGTLDEE